MRPKKRILLSCTDEIQQSCLRLQLLTWGYAVIVHETAAESIAWLAENEPDVLLLVAPRSLTNELTPEQLQTAAALTAMDGRWAVPVACWHAQLGLTVLRHGAGMRPVEFDLSFGALRSALRTLSSRRRGPRLGEVFQPETAAGSAA